MMKQEIQELQLNDSNLADKASASPKEKGSFIFLVKILISAVLIFWILHNTNIGEIFEAIRTADLRYLILAYSLLFVGHFLSIFRWRVLLRAQGHDASVMHLFKSYMVGIFFNNLLPSTIGGDTSRAYDSYRIGKSKGNAVAVIFVDRFFGLFALLIFALGALLISRELTQNLPYLYLWLFIGAVGMGIIAWIIFMPSMKISSIFNTLNFPFSAKIKKIIDKIITAFLSFNGRKDALLKALGLSLLLQTNVIIHYFLITESLGFHVAIYNYFLIIPISLFIMMIPISINGIGLRENVFAFFFASLGVSNVDAVALAWIAYGFVIIQGIIGGVIYALRK